MKIYKIDTSDDPIRYELIFGLEVSLYFCDIKKERKIPPRDDIVKPIQNIQ